MKLVIYTLLLPLLGCAASALAGSRYHLEIVKDKLSPTEIPPQFSVDLDGDGRPDPVTYSAPQGYLAISFSGGGHYEYRFGEALHDLTLKFIALPGSHLPSIVTSRTAEPWRPTGNREQLSFVNRNGKLSPQSLGINIFGRGVDCLAGPDDSAVVCLFSSYRGRSKLVRLDADGRAQDLTKNSGLSFPDEYHPQRLNGYFMMDARFFDFTGDGIADLVMVGQHSEVLAAEGESADPLHFASPVYTAPRGEYMRLYAPPERQGLKSPPCFYIAMERAESDFPDYVRCYDRGAKTWYDLQLPGARVLMDYDYVPFWDYDRDGRIDFAAKDLKGTWRVYTLAE